MRIEWDLKDFKLTHSKTLRKFQKIAQKFQMEWKIIFNNSKTNVAIFVSKQDHCLFDLLYRYKSGELNCNIKLIISNHKDCQKLAQEFNVPFYFINSKSKEVLEKETLLLLRKNKINLIILARFMQILSKDFVKVFPNRILNIHHSFLPAFIGAKPYHQALYTTNTRQTKIDLKKSINEDAFILQTIGSIGELDRSINLLAKHLL